MLFRCQKSYSKEVDNRSKQLFSTFPILSYIFCFIVTMTEDIGQFFFSLSYICTQKNRLFVLNKR